MLIDYRPGDHLRVGRLIIARARQVESGPIIDGGGVTLHRMDEDAARAVVADAIVLTDRIHRFPEHATMASVLDAAANLRGAICGFEQEDVEHYGAIVVHRRGDSRAVAIGWRDRRPPHPARWRPRFLLAHARWVLAGRPANVYLHESGQLRPKVAGGGERSVEFIERSALGLDGDATTPTGWLPQPAVRTAHLLDGDDCTPFGDGIPLS